MGRGSIDVRSSVWIAERDCALRGANLLVDTGLDEIALFGGIAGAALAVDELEVCRGLVLRRTYAHLMSPYILALRRPERPGEHHPGPWKPAHGGIWLDVEMEVALARGVRPTSFDRLNTLWWTLALLRLVSGAALRMPVVCDTALSEAPQSAVQPRIWPVETLPRQLRTVREPPEVLDEGHLRPVRDLFATGARLMNDAAFARAFQAFDGAIWAHSAGSALVTLWAALETLIRPGRSRITKRLAACVAALLEPPGAERQRLFQRVESLYEARGGSAHASRTPEAEQLVSSFEIARRTFIACMERGALPDVEQLQERWRQRR